MLHEFATTDQGVVWADLTQIYVVEPAGPATAKIILSNGFEYTVTESAGAVANLVREAHKAVDRRRHGPPQNF